MTEIEQIHGQIANAEAKVEQMMSTLDAAVGGVSAELGAKVSEWMSAEYMANYKKRAAEGLPDGLAEQVGRMKGELQDLLNRAAGLADDALGDESEVPHRRVHKAGGSSTSYSLEGASWVFLKRAFNEAVLPLGELLRKHGHIDLPAQRMPTHGWVLRSGEVVREYEARIEQRDFTAFTEYVKGSMDLRSKLDRLKSLRSQLAQAQAVDLWDKAG